MLGRMDCFGVSDIGCRRETNQDQFLIADLHKSIVIHHSTLGYDEDTEISGASRAKLLVVADGMGGYSGGERASSLALEGIIQYLLNNLHWPIHCKSSHEAHFFKGLHSALEFSEARIKAVANAIRHKRMGTTLTLAWIVWPHAYLVYVGDSRAYHHHDGVLCQLSRDQTLAQALVDQGLLDVADAEQSRFSNVLVSALGCSDIMEPLYTKIDLELNDSLLVCTDGLTKHLSDGQIAAQIADSRSAKTTCHQLVNAAKEDGGSDNITVVLARFLTNEPTDDHVMHAHCEDHIIKTCTPN